MIKKTITLWESDAKNRLGTPYLKVKRHLLEDGTSYDFAERAGKDSVKFVLVDFRNGLIGALKSPKPIEDMEGNFISTFSGSLDKDGKALDEILLEEVKEEAGYGLCEDSEIKVLKVGEFLLSSSMNEVAHLYLVDITDAKHLGRELEEQEGNHITVWVDKEEDILNSTSALLQTAYLHLKKQGFLFTDG
jgi:8-oxo-dGTP pyrophosphatase MutT (NUDIX family)